MNSNRKLIRKPIPALKHSLITLRISKTVSISQLPKTFYQDVCDVLKIQDLTTQTKINFIEDDDHLAKHYIDRIHTIHEGIIFLLDCKHLFSYAYKDQLLSYFRELKKSCCKHINSLKTNDINIYQACLGNYLKAVKDNLANELSISKDVINHYLSTAEELALALKPKSTICTIIPITDYSAPYYVAMIDQPENPYNHPTLKLDLDEIKNRNILKSNEKLPKWFTELEAFQQTMVWNFLNKLDLASTNLAISSKCRIMPVQSNFAMHTLVTSEKIYPPILRSAHIGTRDVKNNDARLIHAKRNFEVQLEVINKLATSNNPLVVDTILYIPILFQTLITPIKEPDKSLEHDRLDVCSSLRLPANKNFVFDLFLSNHALNYGKYWDFTRNNTYTGKALLRLISAINSNRKRLPVTCNLHLLDCATRRLSSALESYEFYSAYRELYIAAISQVAVISAGGYTEGSCVSGKDRKAILTALVIAMFIYYEKTNSLPVMSPETLQEKIDSDYFAEIFGHIYLSTHQQALAEQNVPGCFGTKTPSMYLPQFLIDGIHRAFMQQKSQTIALSYINTMLDESDRLASNNELKEIHPASGNQAFWQPREEYIVFLTLEDLELMIKAICNKIKGEYLQQREQNLSLLSHLFNDTERGKFRAHAYYNLLIGPKLNRESKLLLICALLFNDDGTQLKKSVVNALGFKSTASAKNAILRLTTQTILTADPNQLAIFIKHIQSKLNSLSNYQALLTAESLITDFCKRVVEKNTPEITKIKGASQL